MLASATVARSAPPRASPPETFAHFDGIPSLSLRVKRGHSLFHVGDPFSSIHSVRFGSFKTFTGDYEGRLQVTGFALPGDVLGLDGIAAGRQTVSAVALEDSEVVVLSFASLERAARDDCALQHELHALMSRQIVHDHGVMMMLGSLCANERVAAFLLNLSHRYQGLGYSAGEFHLRMTRADIGSYLGLKVETVSRTLSKLAETGLIEVAAKHLRLVDLAALEQMWKGERDGTGNEIPDRTQRVIEQARMARADARNVRQGSAIGAALSKSMRAARA